MTEKRYKMVNTNLTGGDGLVYYNIKRDDGYSVCQVFGKNTARKIVDELNHLHEENQRLKAQLFVDSEEGVCYICKHQYLIEHPQIQGFYIAKCKKAYEECSKESLNYCEDFEIKEDIE